MGLLAKCPVFLACTTLSRVSRESSQTRLTRQGMNTFLALPAAPVLMVLIGSLGTQAAAVIVTDMLATVGAPGVSGLRMAAAAVIMVALFRPKLTGMTRARAINIVVYGVAMGMMSMMVYAAIARLPQGVAVTIDFLGPASCRFSA